MDDRATHHTPFPPRPRSWTRLTDRIIAAAAAARGPVEWRPVHLEGLTGAWVGVQAPALDTERSWQWEVATPEDCAKERLLRTDPLTLAVAQDVVVVDLCRHDDPSTRVRLQLPVERVPESIDLAASALPPPPWHLELATGWSARAIARAVRAWSRTRVGHEIAIHPGDEVDAADADADDRFALGDDLWATSDGFEALLALGPREAAMATTAFQAVREALARAS